MTAAATKDLTRADVVRLARKAWGPRAATVTEYRDAPTPDERERAVRRMAECRRELERMPLPNGSSEIAAQRRVLHNEIATLERSAYTHRCNISKLMSTIGSSIRFTRGYAGDSWEDVARDAALIPKETA